MSNGSERTPEYPAPSVLCGVFGCCYLPEHLGTHSWEVAW